jgi:hypothetical protein
MIQAGMCEDVVIQVGNIPRSLQNPVSGIWLIEPRLIGVNAAQLAIALVSNLFLLLNMAQSVRFSIAQPITVVGW